MDEDNIEDDQRGNNDGQIDLNEQNGGRQGQENDDGVMENPFTVGLNPDLIIPQRDPNIELEENEQVGGQQAQENDDGVREIPFMVGLNPDLIIPQRDPNIDLEDELGRVIVEVVGGIMAEV